MMLLCKNEKWPHEYSNQACSMLRVNKPKRIGPFDRRMDTVSKLVKTKGLSVPQLSWQQQKYYVKERIWPEENASTA